MKNAEQKNFQNGIKSAGLILRPNTFLPEAYAYIKEILDSQNIALHVECESAKGCGVGGGAAFEWLCKN